MKKTVVSSSRQGNTSSKLIAQQQPKTVFQQSAVNFQNQHDFNSDKKRSKDRGPPQMKISSSVNAQYQKNTPGRKAYNVKVNNLRGSSQEMKNLAAAGFEVMQGANMQMNFSQGQFADQKVQTQKLNIGEIMSPVTNVHLPKKKKSGSLNTKQEGRNYRTNISKSSQF